MHLRSGKSIASGSVRPSKVSTRGSGVGYFAPLDPIKEEPISSESDTNSVISDSMSSHSNEYGFHSERPQFNVCLLYARENHLGAKLYVDPSN